MATEAPKKGDRCYRATLKATCRDVMPTSSTVCWHNLHIQLYIYLGRLWGLKWNHLKLTMATWWSFSGHRLHQFSFHDSCRLKLRLISGLLTRSACLLIACLICGSTPSGMSLCEIRLSDAFTRNGLVPEIGLMRLLLGDGRHENWRCEPNKHVRFSLIRIELF
jgi:hypothetical protein